MQVRRGRVWHIICFAKNSCLQWSSVKGSNFVLETRSTRRLSLESYANCSCSFAFFILFFFCSNSRLMPKHSEGWHSSSYISAQAVFRKFLNTPVSFNAAFLLALEQLSAPR